MGAWQGQSGVEFDTSAFGNMVAVLTLGSNTFQKITEKSPGGQLNASKILSLRFRNGTSLSMENLILHLEMLITLQRCLQKMRRNLQWRVA